MVVKKIFERLNQRTMHRFKDISENPEQFQKELLLTILKDNQRCAYGEDFKFSEIGSIKEFQERVPVFNYKDLEPRIEKMKKGERDILTTQKILFFATTSGTTSTPKFIPITKKRLKNFKEDYTLWAIFALRDHPEMIKGKSLLLTGSNHDGYTEGRIPHGSISGYLATKLPWFMKKKLIIPFEIYNLKDFDDKIHKIARLSLEENVSQVALSSPIEILLLFGYMNDNRESLTKEIHDNGNKRRARELDKLKNFGPKDYWPNLALLNYIKGGFARFYLDRVREIIGSDVAIRDPGIYSSEGRVSLCLSDKGAKGVIPAGSNFFEFMEVKENDLEKPVILNDLETGKNYSVLLTTQEGLYRYDLGDVVRVVSFYKKLPVVEFVDRREVGLSIVGEHVTESELVNTVKNACKNQRMGVVYFSVIPNIKGEKPRYEFLIEPKQEINDEQAGELIRRLDDELKSQNFLYKKVRQDYGRLETPLVSILLKGSFDNLNKKRIENAGVKQLKPINLSQDPNYRKMFKIKRTYGT